MTQNTAQMTRPRPTQDPEATAYLDHTAAAEAYSNTPQYWERAAAEAQDVIARLGLVEFVNQVRDRAVSSWYEQTAAYATDVDDVFTGDLVLP